MFSCQEATGRGYFAAGGGNVADEVIMQNIGGHLS
jgi:hypothetical protein